MHNMKDGDLEARFKEALRIVGGEDKDDLMTEITF